MKLISGIETIPLLHNLPIFGSIKYVANEALLFINHAFSIVCSGTALYRLRHQAVENV